MNWPRFEKVASKIADKLRDCDLAGYNIEKYDLPILKCEFKRVQVADFAKNTKIIDVMKIYHKNVHLDLDSAVHFYLGRSHRNAHSASADAKATAEILLKQVIKHNLSGDAKALQEYCRTEKEDRP